MPDDSEERIHSVPEVPEGEPSPEWISTPAVQELVANIVAGWWHKHTDDILTRRMEQTDLANAVWKRLYDREVWNKWNGSAGSNWRTYLIMIIKYEIVNERHRYMGNPEYDTLVRQARKVYAERHAWEEKHHRLPTPVELAEATGMRPSAVVALMHANDLYRAEMMGALAGDNPEEAGLDSRAVRDAFGAGIPIPGEQPVSALEWLSPDDRDLILRREHGERVEDLASEQGVSLSTMYRRLAIIKKRIEARGPQQRDES